MNSSRFLVAVLVLPLGVLVACSSSVQQVGSPGVSPSAAGALVTPSVQPAPSHEGRNLSSCADGRCRVVVKAGDTIPTPDALAATVRVTAIVSGTVRLAIAYASGARGFMSFSEGGGGSVGAGGHTLTVDAVMVGDGRAVLQITSGS